MEKTVAIGKRKVKLANNVKWLKIYKQQFLHDITPDLIPLLTAVLALAEGIETGTDSEGKEVKRIDPQAMTEAAYHLAGLEITTLINVTWAMAKTADASIAEPDEWLEELGEFPLDTIAPVVIELAGKGLLSSKNLKRLLELAELLKP